MPLVRHVFESEISKFNATKKMTKGVKSPGQNSAQNSDSDSDRSEMSIAEDFNEGKDVNLLDDLLGADCSADEI